MHLRSTQPGGSTNDDKTKWNRTFLNSEPKASARCAKSIFEDSQRTTLGHNSFAADSQMTTAEQQSSIGSQNCSYNDSQASIPAEEAVPSQHRLSNQLSISQASYKGASRTGDRFDPPSVSRAQTPVSVRGLVQEHRPPKAPTWNSTLIKRAASPVTSICASLPSDLPLAFDKVLLIFQVFEALRNMDAVTNSPKSTTSTPPSLDTVVNLLRTSNVEPLVRELAKEIEGRFELLRSQIREGKDEGHILELIQDQEKNILHAVHQVHTIERSLII